MAARRKTRRRRDRLNGNARALAKLGEALMASLMIRVSPALEEHRAPATSNGGGSSVSHGEGTLAGKIDEVKAYKHQGAWKRLTAVRIIEEARWRRLCTVRVFGSDGSFVEGSKERRRSSGVAQNGFAYGCRS